MAILIEDRENDATRRSDQRLVLTALGGAILTPAEDRQAHIMTHLARHPNLEEFLIFALAGLPTVRVVLTEGLLLIAQCHLFVPDVRAKHLCSHRSPDRASGIDRRSPPHTLKSPGSFGRRGEASQEQCSACPDARSIDASPLPIIITALSTFARAARPTARAVSTKVPSSHLKAIWLFRT